MNVNDSSELNERVKERYKRAKRKILEYIAQYGKAYSLELVDIKGLPISINTVRRLLNEMEHDRLLESWISYPPHADNRNSNLRRRYYKIPYFERA